MSPTSLFQSYSLYCLPQLDHQGPVPDLVPFHVYIYSPGVFIQSIVKADQHSPGHFESTLTNMVVAIVGMEFNKKEC